jgi:septal ring factor EnvC (AmiA/AmiB activator)
MSAVFASGAAENSSTLTQTRTTLEQWVETRQLISKTRSDWQTDKESLEQTVQLYERELKSIEEQMSKVSTNNTQVDKERGQAEASLKTSNEGLDRAREFATVFEGKVAKVVPQLPEPLQEILKPMLARLPADPANTKMAVTERVQVLVGILNEMDKFNNAVNLFSEKRKNDKGEEVAVETVYVGLGAAYFVNDADNFAGMGTPGPNGWEWTTRPELASAVREVVRIYRNERAARFVALPATIR